MRPRWKKVLADLWENKARTLMITASITIGVFAVGVLGVGYLVMPDNAERAYVSASPANIVIRTNSFDEGFVDSIRKIEGVRDVEGRLSMAVRARHPETGEWITLDITAIEDFHESRVNVLTRQSGRAIPQDNEIVLIADTLKTLPVDSGSYLEVELADNTIRTLRVAGIVQEYSASIKMMFLQRRGFVTLETLTYLHQPRLMNTLVVIVSGDVNDLAAIEEVAEVITGHVEDSGRRVISQDIHRATDHPYENYVDAIATILGFIGFFIVVLSSSLIINSMNALMAQHIRQIGVIKLIGGQRAQIIGMYLALVIAFSLISLSLSIPASAFVGREFCEQILPTLNARLYTSGQFLFVPAVIVLQVVVALLIPVLAALFPILRGANVPVQKALLAKLISNGEKSGVLDRWLEKIRSVDGVINLGIRNTFRQKRRLALTIFTLALGSAIFISVFNVELSLKNQVDRIIGYNQSDISLEMAREYPVEEIIARLEAFPGVVYAEAWLTTNAQVINGNENPGVSIIASPDDSPLVARVVDQGRWVLPQEYHSIVVNDAFRNIYPDLKPGDQIVLDLAGKEDTWTISGIFHYSGLDWKLAYVPFDALARDLVSFSHATSFRVIIEQQTLAAQVRQAQQIEDMLRKAGYSVYQTHVQDEIIQGLLDKLDMIIYVLLFLAVLTGIVGGIGLSGTLSLNVLERTGEIGILRAVGAYDRVIIRLVTFEGFIIGLSSYLVGAILSFPISYVLSDLVNMAIFKVRMGFVITPTGFILWLGILIILAIAASYFPARNAARLTIREVLAYE